MTGSVLAISEYGDSDGPPVVMLHGSGGPRDRERLVTECAPQRRWICPHLRGFGASLKSPPWTLEQYAQDLAATLDSLQVERTDVIGASLGGSVALGFAELMPALVRSVVVLDAAVCTPEHYLSRRTIEDATPTIAALQMSISENLPPSLKTFTGSVLILASGASTKHNVTESGTTALRSQLGPRLHVLTITDAGHDLLKDAFDDTVSEIRRFLENADRASAKIVERVSD